MKYEHYCINTIDFRASLEEAEQDVDLLEVKLEKVNVFCDDNWCRMYSLYWYDILLTAAFSIKLYCCSLTEGLI